MTSKEFINALVVAHEVPNCYCNKFPKNLGYYDGNKYSFDCWNLIKVVLSGWKPTGIKKTYIEPKRLVTGDVDGKALLNGCTNRSTDFSKLTIPGTYLYLASDPHSGIYIGDKTIDGKVYNVIEATKNGKFGNGVLYTYVDKDGTRRKYKGSSKTSLKWTEYGLLTKYVDYLDKPLDQAEPVKKDLTAVAKEVINGKYGNGITRINNLKVAGYTDEEIREIQAIVNDLCKQPVQNTEVWHTVKSGEIASLIVKKYGVSLESVKKLNPNITNWNLIYPGQKIRIK